MSYLRSGEWRVSGTGKLPMTELLRGSPPGNAGVPPAQHRQSLAHCLDPGQPARAPRLCFGRAHAVPTGRMDGCAIAGKPGGNPRERMRAGRPRSRVGRFRHDCPSRESRRKRTGWMVSLNPDLTIPSWPFVVLRGPWWITLFPFVFFRLFRIIGGAAARARQPGRGFPLPRVFAILPRGRLNRNCA